MDTIPYIFFFCLIWQHCYLYDLYDVPQECNKALLNGVKPINLSVTMKERVLNLSWDCGFPPEIKSMMGYEVYLKNDEGYDYKTGTKKCYTEITLETISAVCLKVIPAIKDEECQYLSSEKCITLERNGTSAENVSCRVYNISSMKCTWMLGKNVSHSTSYILSLKQGTTSIQCQEYETNFHARTGSCTFHDLRVHFFEDATIFLQGSDPGMEVFGEHIQLAHIEIFNPPRDISVTSVTDSITIYWQSPQKQYDASDECFEYIIEKNQNSYNPTSNPFTISNIEKECSVRMRAKGIKKCDMNTHWGEWSKWIPCGPLIGASHSENELQVELIPVILVSGLILVILIMITLQYKRIVNTCFPRIPQPKNYFESTEECKLNLENNYYFSPILPKYETEECIVVKENFS